jgi:cell pole-organizing protein PopZ
MTTNPISSAMDRLARAVEDAKPPIAAPDAGPLMTSGRTLEDLVKEMLRPMVQDWLDKNLPQLVERMVDREVQRLTRG